MIDEERVKELYHMAVYDAQKDQNDIQTGQYFRWDFISKELVKSIVLGTIAYVLMAVLWGISRIEEITEMLNKLDFLGTGVRLIVLYIGFMAVYLFVTVVVYSIRYARGRKRIKSYAGHMNKVRKMYQRDDRLKS